MRFSIENSVKEINQQIESYKFGNDPANLYDPIRYIMGLGGKRLRPLLALLSHQLFSENLKIIYGPAVAIEVFHNFTLMHDDIMDKAPLRRGKPTVHEKWNSNVAILSGDVMLVKSYELLMQVENEYLRRALAAFNECATGVCEGQQLDVNFESMPDISLEQYLHMIRLKTAVLLGYSMELGAMTAGAGGKDILLLKDFGTNIGMAFQLMDDLLDVYGDKDKFGKKVGGDILARKKTFLFIKALQLAKGADLKTLKALLKNESPDEKVVVEVTNVYSNLGIGKLTEAAIQNYFNKAIYSLTKVDAGPFRKNTLKTFVSKLMKRES